MSQSLWHRTLSNDRVFGSWAKPAQLVPAGQLPVSGPSLTVTLMLAELRRLSLEGRHLLDIGGGIGVIISELADIRLASAAIVEASPAYLEVARREVGLKYGSRPIRFVGGAFALIAGTPYRKPHPL